MCLPAAPLLLAATAMSAIGTGIGALSANAQAQYKAKIAERNASLEREGWLQAQQNTRDASLAHYREIARIKGQQRVTAAANGVAIDFGTAGDVQSDAQLLGDEDQNRLYKQGYQNMRGHDIAAANFMGEANAARAAGKGALVKGVFDMGSTILDGASQYANMKPK